MTQEFEKGQKLLIDQIESLTNVMDSIARFSEKCSNKPAFPLPENDELKNTLKASQEKLQELIRAIKVPVPSDGN